MLSAAAATAAASRTSTGCAKAFGDPDFSHSAASSSIALFDREVSTSFAPFWAHFSASSRPKPPVAPVIQITESLLCMLLSFSRGEWTHAEDLELLALCRRIHRNVRCMARHRDVLF